GSARGNFPAGGSAGLGLAGTFAEGAQSRTGFHGHHTRRPPMRTLRALIERELKSLFYSPIAYVVLCLVLALSGLNFYLIVAAFSAGPTPVTVVEAFFNTGAFWFSFFAIFPLITMRLYAEEFRLGTYELLQTAPVHDWQIVLSKFAGAYL